MPKIRFLNEYAMESFLFLLIALVNNTIMQLISFSSFQGSDMIKPIDKKVYKGTNPSSHDFNTTTATSTGAPLLIGFTTGQIQLVSPQLGPRELRKLYNEEVSTFF